MRKIIIFLLALGLLFPGFVFAEDPVLTDVDKLSASSEINLENCSNDYCSCSFVFDGVGKWITACSTDVYVPYFKVKTGSTYAWGITLRVDIPGGVCVLKEKTTNDSTVSETNNHATNIKCEILNHQKIDGCSCDNSALGRIVTVGVNGTDMDPNAANKVRQFKDAFGRCPKKGDIMTGGTNSDLECKNLFAEESCCCIDGAVTALSINRKCEKIKEVKELTGNCALYASSLDKSVLAVQKPLDKNGGCSAYEQELLTKGTVTGDVAFKVSMEKLQNDAKELNPMSFGLGTAGVNTFVGKAISFLTMAMGSLLLLFYVYAGILWMTAMGNSERAGKAKQIVVWSTLGVVVVLASYMIVKFVFSNVG